jgi:small GTP-binding protein
MKDEGGRMKDEARNQAALLTPPGVAAIAVVRIRGALVEQFLAKYFSKTVRAGRCVHGTLADATRVIDDPVIVASQDHLTADINLHGGEWVVRECVELARCFGFEVVEASEQMLDSEDEIEEEMLAALPWARTEQGLRMLFAQPPLWSQLLKGPGPVRKARSAEMNRALESRSLWWMLHPPTIAVVGIPNVGKSTIANLLFGQDRSITADLPGTTRDWVGDWANIDGLPAHLLDTPGQRESPDAIEQAAIKQSRAQIERADLAIVVLDATQPPEPQRAILSQQSSRVVVVNKSDLPAMWDPQPLDAIPMIANQGVGGAQLRLAIRRCFDCEDLRADRLRWWTPRQQELLRRIVR